MRSIASILMQITREDLDDLSTGTGHALPGCGAAVPGGRAACHAAHLTGIYAALTEGAAAETNRAVQQWLNGPKVIPRPGHPAPRQRGALTVLHIHGAVDPEEYVRRVRERAVTMWEAWRDYHHVARQWVEQATANRPTG